jgi:drug/metabolite transporter superfamily protein YnfA
MRKALPAVVAALGGAFVLIALIWRPQLEGWLEVVLSWLVILAAVAALVAIATLLHAHSRKIIKGRHGLAYSLILIAAFLASFIGGMTAGVDNPSYLRWIAAIELPAEASLLGLTALVMAAPLCASFTSAVGQR